MHYQSNTIFSVLCFSLHFQTFLPSLSLPFPIHSSRPPLPPPPPPLTPPPPPPPPRPPLHSNCAVSTPPPSLPPSSPLHCCCRRDWIAGWVAGVARRNFFFLPRTLLGAIFFLEVQRGVVVIVNNRSFPAADASAVVTFCAKKKIIEAADESVFGLHILAAKFCIHRPSEKRFPSPPPIENSDRVSTLFFFCQVVNGDETHSHVGGAGVEDFFFFSTSLSLAFQ